MRLRDYLRADLVVTDLQATDQDSALHALVAKLVDAGAVSDGEATFQGLMEREASHTTALGHGLALPHTTVDGLEEPVLLLALGRTPIPFGPPEADPVQVFFLLLSPPGREGEHIKLLARICRLVRHDRFMEELVAAPSPNEALAFVRSVDEQHV